MHDYLCVAPDGSNEKTVQLAAQTAHITSHTSFAQV